MKPIVGRKKWCGMDDNGIVKGITGAVGKGCIWGSGYTYPKKSPKSSNPIGPRAQNVGVLFPLFSMTRLGNTKIVVFLRCRLLINMTNGVKLSYY